MRCVIRKSRALQLALAAAGTLIAGGPALAAEAPEEVVIESVSPSTMVHRSHHATDRVFSITRRVSYADLDLVRHADVETLESRINETAESICAALSRAIREPGGFDEFRCRKQAVRDAMAQARAAIAAAESKTRTAEASPS